MSAEKIDITDLRNPVLTDIQHAARAAAEANPVRLTEAAVLSAAQAATGLSDFGDDDFRVRLGLWLKGTREDANLSAAGRAGIFMDAVRYASNRLKVEDLVKRHPDPQDKRGVLVRLTDAGRARVDEAFGDLIDRERHLLASLSPDQRRSLADLLRSLLIPFDADPGG